MFRKDEPLIIYGFDFLAKEIYHELKNKCNILFFLDRAHDGEIYDNTPIYSLDNSDVPEKTMKYKEVILLVTIISDIEKILNDTTSRIKNVKYFSLYKLFTSCKLKWDTEFIETQNPETLSVLDKMLDGEKTDISCIILVGTAYTELLGMLYIDEWKNALFILERYVSQSIADNMKSKGMYCLYEKNAVEYYDISYMIADYARRMNIPVFGHDHMQLSRAFLSNNIHVLEDGLANYDGISKNQYFIILDCGRRYYSFGYDELVQEMILTNRLFEVPESIKSKIKWVNPALLWVKKSYEDKRHITDIMGFEYDIICKEVESGRDIIFLTEPNIADGEVILNVDEQMKVYSKILSRYPQSKVMIKPHPADNIDYASYFPQHFVMTKRFPIQLLEWFDIKISKFIIMNGSSCVDFFKNRYPIDIYDNDL